MECKPTEWNQIDQGWPKKSIDLLEKFTDEELGIRQPYDRLIQPTPQYFILIRKIGDKLTDVKEYLCNTEGYDYIKYYARVK